MTDIVFVQGFIDDIGPFYSKKCVINGFVLHPELKFYVTRHNFLCICSFVIIISSRYIERSSQAQ